MQVLLFRKISIFTCSKNLQPHIDLRYCNRVTDVGVLALGHGCGQLEHIDLEGCNLVTDVGVSALGHGCGQLEYIDLEGCNLVTCVCISDLKLKIKSKFVSFHQFSVHWMLSS